MRTGSYGEPTMANRHMANWPYGELAIWQTDYGDPAYGELVHDKMAYSPNYLYNLASSRLSGITGRCNSQTIISE